MSQTEIGQDLGFAAEVLLKGGLVAVPTETVYGLAGSIYKGTAIKEIFRVKNRPTNDPLIVHTYSPELIREEIASNLDGRFTELANAFWPGPLTLVLKKKPEISNLLTSGLNTVAVRIPKHQFFLELLEMVHEPLAAPSANPFGYISPTSPIHVLDQLQGKIPYILDGGSCDVGIESTILDLSTGEPLILREGMVTRKDLENYLGPIPFGQKDLTKIISPGGYEKHYSPKTLTTAIEYGEDLKETKIPKNTGLILFNSILKGHPPENQFMLSESGELLEAAKNLYLALRIMDKRGVNQIIIEKVPNSGVGIAINDRIYRASRK
jgi:L-threonylcarbamoyladenylate synthase